MLIANQKNRMYLQLLRPKSCKQERYRDKFDPLEVIDEIFENYAINQLRFDLWELVKAGIEDTETYGTPHEINDLMFLHDIIQDLLTACYLIAEEREQKDNTDKN